MGALYPADGWPPPEALQVGAKLLGRMEIVDAIEAILFVADAPVPLGDLARAVAATEGQAEQALEILQERLENQGALQVIRIAGGYQLCTKPHHADRIADFLKPQRQKLSRSLLEVLAIVAYRQPITMAEIEAIRGVQSDYSVRALLERRLVHEVGRRRAPGRPLLYGTTQQFLHQFKLNSLEDLPPLAPDAVPPNPDQFDMAL
jgi:segregation and condensation protein B